MSEGEISLNFGDLKKSFERTVRWFKQEKVAVISSLLILAAILITGVLIRIQNLSLLHDVTTGQYIPLALDPFYWLRMATTILHTGGLPAIDPYHVIAGGSGFSPELLPWVIVGLYKVLHLFSGGVTLQFADVIYPVIAFVVGVTIFYFLVYAFTKSRVTSLISAGFLAIIPTYLYRTMAGFADHDALGMAAFFLTLLAYTYSLKWLNKEKSSRKINLISLGFGALIGLLSTLTIASWGGVSDFIFMIIPLSFFLFWILKAKDSEGHPDFLKYLIFYASFVILTLVFSLTYGFNLTSVIGKVLSDTSLLMGLVLMFIIADFIILRYIKKTPFRNLEKHHVLVSLGFSLLIGIIVASVHGGLFSFVSDVIVNRLLHPFGTSRVSLTVAENAQPNISDWISQTGTIFFWLFAAGLFPLGVNISKSIKSKKRKIWFVVLWTFFMAGLLFSRISPNSIFNGTNLLSKLFYFGSAAIFVIYCINLYRKEKLKIPPQLLILASLTVFTLIAARGAARLIFFVTPFACFFLAYLIYNIGAWLKRSKGDLAKMFLFLVLIGVVIASIFSFNNLTNQSVVQAKYTGPSATYDWQHAMQWVRNNTPLNATFAHWWDYGYWVEYLGNRSTIADGGHFEGAFRDHLIGRYLLTEPNQNVSLSFMKTNNVSYLLIDPSDLGKYPAYSIIGSDASGNDRYSSVPIMPLASGQTQTQGNSTVMVYQNVVPTDAEIFYNSSHGQIIIPQGKGYVVGLVLNMTQQNSSVTFAQPRIALYYNNQQMVLPLRYLYFNGKLIDFKSGYNGGAYVLPSMSQSSSGIQINPFGSVIYLSPKVFSSLFAQLYLMNDPFKKYPTVTLAHSQDDQLLQSLKSQGFTGDFIYYNGFYGPIKIWHVSYPSYIINQPDFLAKSGQYAEFDNATVTD